MNDNFLNNFFEFIWIEININISFHFNIFSKFGSRDHDLQLLLKWKKEEILSKVLYSSVSTLPRGRNKPWLVSVLRPFVVRSALFKHLSGRLIFSESKYFTSQIDLCLFIIRIGFVSKCIKNEGQRSEYSLYFEFLCSIWQVGAIYINTQCTSHPLKIRQYQP